ENVKAERGSLVVLDENQHPVEAAIVYGNQLHAHTLDQLQDVVDQGLAGWVMQNQKPALISDTSIDERWLHRPDDSEERSGAKSVVCVPLKAREKLVGILTIVHPTRDFFNKDHLAIVQAIADIAGIAVHNAQLYDSLDQAHNRYHDLFDDSIDPIVITDWNGRVLEANRQAAITAGMPAEVLRQKTIFQLHEVRLEKLGEKFENLRSGEAFSYQSHLQRQGEVQLPVEVYVRRINISSDDNLQWIFHNISERIELDSLRDDLTAMIYHDLRSPLSNIVSSLDILSVMLPADDNPSLKSVLQIATRSTDRLQRLISSLLDINRLEAGQPITNRKDVEIPNLVKDAVDAVQPILESKQQHLEVKLSDGLSSINVDVDMIRRVLINLLENATKYSPVHGAISIGASQSDSEIMVWIDDSGPGIPDEAREMIFEKFTRLHVEHAPKGLGLGLAFCRLAIKAHDGKIWVERLAETGSRFSIALPVNR
ncbi:MAG: GAF domain-containing protein, partial [Anaerolineaceae bacterium]|nr:GAF domain-containing protein [Anaerolineaceae bacterium]